MFEEKVCVYCTTITSSPICFVCNEYDGLMDLADAAEYLPEVFEYLLKVV
jgi:hypothetical protein